MNRDRIWTGMIIILLLFLRGISSAQSSENYSLKKSVIDAAGGVASSASYSIQDAIGQSVIGESVSGMYGLSTGYFASYLEATDVEERLEANRPEKFRLYQNYPNPFNPETTIQFDVKESCEVRLSIYDMLGREIGVLVKDHYDPGAYTVTFNASSIPSGIYIYKIQMGEFNSVKKMVILE